MPYALVTAFRLPKNGPTPPNSGLTDEVVGATLRPC